ncbi:hypothetical protein H6P81_014239 [Aristolochia fimbriata]|uniref:Uncharacterized protein n=1 Tax=Aristolochia fimbriata TaxID=158543 RepID=A0AAV7EK91_ARIFI|nr:hypothetical protein H6P81_014239 [Aristolochia fimbriata]
MRYGSSPSVGEGRLRRIDLRLLSYLFVRADLRITGARSSLFGCFSVSVSPPTTEAEPPPYYRVKNIRQYNPTSRQLNLQFGVTQALLARTVRPHKFRQILGTVAPPVSIGCKSALGSQTPDNMITISRRPDVTGKSGIGPKGKTEETSGSTSYLLCMVLVTEGRMRALQSKTVRREGARIGERRSQHDHERHGTFNTMAAPARAYLRGKWNMNVGLLHHTWRPIYTEMN